MTQLAGTEAAILPDDAPHLLVIDDDQRIRSLLSRYLSDNGFRVDVAANAEEARTRLGSLAFDLLILDVMMPGENGLDLLKSLRETMQVPILMLTARTEIDHRIRGFEGGADDYLGKPFEPRELVLRINAILKRGTPPTEPLIEQLRFGPFSFHIGRRELRRGQEVIRLTDRERQIMAVFAATPNETVPRLSLLSEDEPAGERTIDVQINRLRRKIEVDPANPLYLQTVRGIGYRLVTEA
ncbi:two-component system, OmpR family, phosphate regulon response regulator OmpR [Kaistia soli DSM 19436]|uniref:Two-component system, OmpR family, phosphate regulon response regulator OmpR n=1 Tax=Kaistia soli DSM 19436 TaxID=1122133 RepID=A0A1M4ZBU7_9HYPH|nr:response regulator transcription factor [Kaistia soli]SHF15445.1 two-component system, OmpR family, phosphate regulon response regulator OmpR [Kaistia soli DSM 19436]